MKNICPGRSLLVRSLWFYRRSIVLVSLGTALTAMIVTGALMIGDSVRGTLGDIAKIRTGAIKTAVLNSERWFRADIADKLTDRYGGKYASVISMRAYVTAPHQKTGVSVSLYACGKELFDLSYDTPEEGLKIGTDEVFLNRTASEELQVGPGDYVVVRVFSSSAMPPGAPMSDSGDDLVTTRLKVAKVLDSRISGDLSFEINQNFSPNIFVDRETFARRIGREGRANVVFSDISDVLSEKIEKVAGLEDYGLYLESRPGFKELLSERVFLSKAVDSATIGVSGVQQRIFGYLVNDISFRENNVPYSFIAGTDYLEGFSGLRDDEIVVNQWLADELGCVPGDGIHIKAYRLDNTGNIYEKGFDFVVRDIIPMDHPGLDPYLMPRFPGLENADSCSDWDDNLPIDFKRIRPEDEDYWRRYRGTPKAFMTLSTARSAWGNRFGELTAVRFYTDAEEQSVAKKLLRGLRAEELGFRDIDLVTETREGIDNAVDFSGLFIALSFFIVVASLTLTMLLFGFHLQLRHKEYAILKIIGFRDAMVFRSYLAEVILCTAAGIVPGSLAGILYTRIVVSGLNSIWSGAVGGTSLDLFITSRSLAAGAMLSFCAVIISVSFSLSRFFRSTVLEKATSNEKHIKINIVRTSILAAIFFLLYFITFLTGRRVGAMSGPEIFFLSGIMLLMAFTFTCKTILGYFSRLFRTMSVWGFAWRNCARRPGRSMAIITMLAWGFFVVLAVSMFRKDPVSDTLDKSSGTGGFFYYMETAIPIRENMNSVEGREKLRLSDIPDEVFFVTLPVERGTEASCLNLHRVTRPNIAGVDPELLAGRFGFQSMLDGKSGDWQILDHVFEEEDIIPALADMNVILWSLGKDLGDDIKVIGPGGHQYRLRFVGGLEDSVFQGNVLVSLENFYRIYPDQAGASIALVDVPEGLEDNIASAIVQALGRYGLGLEKSASRLNRFNTVQNTYIAVFSALGVIGLMLGCGAIAILVKRELMERQSEITFLRTIGFSVKRIRSMLFFEQIILFVLGIACGAFAAIISVMPTAVSLQMKGIVIETAVSAVLMFAVAVLAIKSAARIKNTVDLTILDRL